MEVESLSKTEEVDELVDDDGGGFESEEDEEDPHAFKIRGSLQPHVVKICTTLEVHQLIHDGGVDLNPSYQRDVVWPETKQIGLIDSIFRNFYIPPVVLAVQRDEDGEETRVCVDGKQRLTSIVKFFDGSIPHRDSITKKNFWYTTPDSYRGVRTELPNHWKQWFAKRTLTMVEYEHLTASEEREIFQRVQLGMPLTAAEKLQSISSPWAEWITQLEARHVAIEDGLATKLSWDIKRGRDFQNIAHMVFCCDGLPEELLPTSQKVEKWMSRVDNPSTQFMSDIETVLRTLWVIATTEGFNEGFTNIVKRIAPVEFIFIGVLLYVLRKQTRQVQGRAIYILRDTIRQEFKDIRNNTDVGRAMWRHINSLRDRPTSWIVVNASKGQGNASKGKRKRNAVQDDDDDFHPQPVKALGKPVKTRAKQSKTA